MAPSTPTKASRGTSKTSASGVQKNVKRLNLQARLQQASAKRAQRMEAGKSEETKLKEKEMREKKARLEEERKKAEKQTKREEEAKMEKRKEQAMKTIDDGTKLIEEGQKKAEKRRMMEGAASEKKMNEENQRRIMKVRKEEEKQGDEENEEQLRSEREALRARNEAANADLPLLRLPAELRNETVKYALTGDMHFLTARNGSFQLSVFRDKRQPFNSLNNVCRQLQAETRDRHLTFNNNYVIEGQTFIAMCLAKDPRLQNLRNTIELHGDMGLEKSPDEAILHNKIIDLAWNNPQATVIVRLHRFHFDTSDKRTFHGFLKLAGVVLKAIRGIQRSNGSRESIQKWKRRKDVKELNAPNLRFFPRDAECDVDELWHFAPLYAAGNVEMMKRWYNGDVTALVADVLSCYDHGL